MTKQEFINKWSTESEDRGGMEFDLISVIERSKNEDLENLLIEKYTEQTMKEEKAYQSTAAEVEKYIKKISFGTMRGQ